MDKEYLLKRKSELESQKQMCENMIQQASANANATFGAIQEVNALIALCEKNESESSEKLQEKIKEANNLLEAI